MKQGEVDELGDESEESGTLLGLTEESKRMADQGHECPIPKPRVILGEILGLRNRKEERTVTRPEIVVEREEKSSRKTSD